MTAKDFLYERKIINIPVTSVNNKLVYLADLLEEFHKADHRTIWQKERDTAIIRDSTYEH